MEFQQENIIKILSTGRSIRGISSKSLIQGGPLREDHQNPYHGEERSPSQLSKHELSQLFDSKVLKSL